MGTSGISMGTSGTLMSTSPDASGRVESDDGSDSDTTNHFTFRKRKPESKLGAFDSRIPLSLTEPGEVDSVRASGEN